MKRILLISSVLLATACSTHNLRDADRGYKEGESETSALIGQMREPTKAGASETVTISSEQWVDPTPIAAVAASAKLPSALGCEPGKDGVPQMKILEPMGLLEFAQLVSQMCKVGVRVTPDALAAMSGSVPGAASSAPAQQGPAPIGGLPLPSLPALPEMGRNFGGAAELARSPAGVITGLEWKGPLNALLDMVAAGNGLSWRYAEKSNSVVIFYLDSRTFQLDAFPTTTTINSTIQTGMSSAVGASSGGVGGAGGAGGSGASGVSGGAGSSQTTTTTMTSSLYKDVENTIKSLLTPSVGRMAMSESTGTITVTDTPEVLDRISGLLDRENETLTKQVTLHAKVLAVTLDDRDEVGINWDLVYKSLSRQFNIKTPFQPASSAGTLGATVIDTGNFAGSNVIVSALSTLGTVKSITSPSLKTLNLRPAPIQIGRQIGYIQSSQISQTEGQSLGGLTPGYVTVGFNMTVTPRLLRQDDELLLNYGISISALNGDIRTEEAGGSKIQFPDVDMRNFASEVRLHAGETLILHGFEQDQQSGNRQGMFSPFAWMLGGSMKASRQRQAIVILITPEIGSGAVAAR